MQYAHKLQRLRWMLLIFLFSATTHAQTKVIVGGSGPGHFPTVQAAVNALPSTGGEVDVNAGTYTETVRITKPNVRLIGQGRSASSTVITFDNSATTLGDEGSSTVIANAAGFFAENITFQNTFTQEGHPEVQALALFTRSDRAVFRNVRLIGRQDTVFLGSAGCNSTTCKPARQYFFASYIEGNVDFIFGDSAVVFDSCVIQVDEHGSLSGETTITAQNKMFTNYLSGFVFFNSQINSNPSTGMTNDYIGRPWGKFSTSIMINTNMQAPISTPGWIEFNPGSTNNLPTSFYAEFGSTGPGSSGFTARKRESHVIYLTSSQVTQYEPNNFLKGSDGWVPTAVR